MKNKTLMVNQRVQNKFLDWLYLEEQEDDFLSGKNPLNLDETLELEEE